MYQPKSSAVHSSQMKVQELSIPVTFVSAPAAADVQLKVEDGSNSFCGLRCGTSTYNTIASLAESDEDIADNTTDYVSASVADANAIVHVFIKLSPDQCSKIVSAQMTNRATGAVVGTVAMADLSKGISSYSNIKLEFAQTGLDLVAAATTYKYCLNVKYIAE